MGLIQDYKRPAKPNPFADTISELAAAPAGSAWEEIVTEDSKLSVSTTKQKIQDAARTAGYSARFQSETVTDKGTSLVFILGAARKVKGEDAPVDDTTEDNTEDEPAKSK